MGLERIAAAGVNYVAASTGETPLERFLRVRRRSVDLAAPLSDEDQAAQSMPDASPVKWHLGHTTWFFEQMLLRPTAGYEPADPSYDLLFNSYYESLGPRVARDKRGLLTRPSANDVMAYRERVDAAMAARLGGGGWEPGALEAYIFDLALHHEQQHQELMLTDVLHLLAQSPLSPAYRRETISPGNQPGPVRFIDHAPETTRIGWAGRGFAFDNEGPRHAVTVAPFQLADRLATNGEWLAFMDDGGYQRADLWMSDGWAVARSEGWTAPLYWTRRDGTWRTMTLLGEVDVDPAAPVAHISWYEADAFARWSGARLPTEAEWEVAAAAAPILGNLAPDGALRALPAGPAGEGPRQLYGDLWEWTGSAYSAYPGFRPTPGVASEYNGKFMINQMVLRGGSFATPLDHIRPTYRNFFHPHQRWQFMGVRLARDLPPEAAPGRRDEAGAFLSDLKAGLARARKSISPKWFYDEAGSRLFEDITDLPEYYLTTVETALLGRIAADLGAAIPDGAALVEFGSGASAKTRLLLDAAPQLAAYVPMDISEDALAAATRRIASAYPRLDVIPLVGDFTQPLRLPPETAGHPLVGFFPGSTIGNFNAEEARRFLRAVRAMMGPGAMLIVGADLVKDRETLIAAYDDTQGVTGAFNLNLLARANRELGADFDIATFTHEARWNADEARIEMHLVSGIDQNVTVGGERFHFDAGESLHTENSHKFTVPGFEALAEDSGWRVSRQWTSPEPRFAIFVLRS